MYNVARKKPRPPEIQMAPLIDMVFLLLIFFMVATVFPENTGVEVQKPLSKTANPLIKEGLIFAITTEGDVFHAGGKITHEQASGIIKGAVAAKPGVSVVIEVDKRAVTDHLIRFLDTAREAGASNLAIATLQADMK
ncbi:MAG: biopolymer transporter ExbD [Nitrospinae bacterium]|nr:biopolymer transporter ExbD [Nitrospinota bacterium]